LNSSIDRRVLDEAHRVSSQSTRDRQSTQNWPGRTLFTPLPKPRPVISIKSTSSATCKRTALQPPARLAIQLEVRHRAIRIFSNSSSHQEPMTHYASEQALKPVEHEPPIFTLAGVGGDIN
jgi:hypothetical protein